MKSFSATLPFNNKFFRQHFFEEEISNIFFLPRTIIIDFVVYLVIEIGFDVFKKYDTFSHFFAKRI